MHLILDSISVTELDFVTRRVGHSLYFPSGTMSLENFDNRFDSIHVFERAHRRR